MCGHALGRLVLTLSHKWGNRGAITQQAGAKLAGTQNLLTQPSLPTYSKSWEGFQWACGRPGPSGAEVRLGSRRKMGGFPKELVRGNMEQGRAGQGRAGHRSPGKCVQCIEV